MRDRSFNKLVQLLETIDPTMNEFPPHAQAMEDHHEHEPHRMAESQVNEIIKNAERIRSLLTKIPHDSEEIQAWMLSKLTLADDYLESVAEVMTNDFKDMEMELDIALEDKNAEIEPMHKGDPEFKKKSKEKLAAITAARKEKEKKEDEESEKKLQAALKAHPHNPHKSWSDYAKSRAASAPGTYHGD